MRRSNPGFNVVLVAVLAAPHQTARITPDASAASAAIDRRDFDTSCRACDEFYQFVNGGWIQRNPIPPDVARWGRYEVLLAQHDEALRRLIEGVAGPRQPFQQQIGDFYASCMDVDAIEAAGLSPIRAQLQQIERMQSVDDLAELLAGLRREGISIPFQLTVDPDERDRRKNIAVIAQGGLGLPHARQYVDAGARELRDRYAGHVRAVLRMSGSSEQQALHEASAVVEVERALAESSRTPEELRAPDENYHKVTVDQLQELTPHFPWRRYWAAVGGRLIERVIVRQPEFLARFDRALVDIAPSMWKAYVRWQLVHSQSGMLPAAYADATFDFYGRRLRGIQVPGPRWKRCLSSVKNNLGPELGRLYVESTFSAEARAHATRLVRTIVATARASLQTVSWMTPHTRQAAIAKLDAMSIKVGYPDRWPARDAIVVTRDAYLENVGRVTRFETARTLDTVGVDVDTAAWSEQPHAINAYYRPELNEIVIPAAIFQLPFYDKSAPMALNFSGIGAVVAHELTHAFDDTGRQYDANGRLRSWWTAEDEAAFAVRAACIERQLASFSSRAGQGVNGKLVLGEALADLGGLTVAYRAWKASASEDRGTEGFTADQLFFIGWARLFGGAMTPAFERMLLATSTHPPPHVRPLAPLQNMPAFAAAFECRERDHMVRPAPERCSFW